MVKLLQKFYFCKCKTTHSNFLLFESIFFLLHRHQAPLAVSLNQRMVLAGVRSFGDECLQPGITF